MNGRCCEGYDLGYFWQASTALDAAICMRPGCLTIWQVLRVNRPLNEKPTLEFSSVYPDFKYSDFKIRGFSH